MDVWNSGSSPFQDSASVTRLPRTVLQFPAYYRREAESLQPARRPASGDYPSVIVVFSPSGGTGKTGLVANLGRALALQGEDVLLLDTSIQENLIHYFGAARAYPGDVQTAYDRKSDTRVRLAQLPIDCYGPGGDGESWLRDEVADAAMECDRIILDLSTASRWLTGEIFRMSPLLLIPMLPDWNAVLSLPAAVRFIEEASDPQHPAVQPHFILNQYNPQMPFHRTVLEELRSRLGERLVSLVLHRSLDVDEALAQGKPVLDFEPDAQISRDYRALADWIRNRSWLAHSGCGCPPAAQQAF